MNPKDKDNLKPIYTAALEAVNPGTALRKHLSLEKDYLIVKENNKATKLNLKSYKNIYIIGAGKATSPMAKTAEDILGNRISEGIISVKYDHTLPLKKIKTIEAGHPLPDLNGFRAAKNIFELVKKAETDDLIISLLSGGGSSLLPFPPTYISLKDKQETTNFLLRCGASIQEINTVRKHLSFIKGGNLSKAAFPATVINFIISDVIGDRLDTIASGPFFPDQTSFEEAYQIFAKYHLFDRTSQAVLDYIQAGCKGEIEENPSKNSQFFKKVSNIIIASNLTSLEAAKNKAEELGFDSSILSSTIEGETQEAALNFAKEAIKVASVKKSISSPICLLSGGETTLEVTGTGLGGRNLEYCLYSAKYLKGFNNIIITSLGTDGTDGPTDAAGAIVDGSTWQQAEKIGLNPEIYLKNNDSYNFFKKLNSLVITGPTNTNVMDLQIALIY